MSLRLEMLQVSRLAPGVLGEATDLVRGFFNRRWHADGGFCNRTGQSDLYYTVFGLDSAIALQSVPSLETVRAYLERFECGDKLDFVHLCCLARCWGALQNLSTDHRLAPGQRQALLARIEQYRTGEGGYNPLLSGGGITRFGTVYGAFLALGAYQDLQGELPDPLRLVQSIKFLETPDGAWSNERGLRIGSTNATAAAVAVLRQLSMPIHSTVGDWLLAQAFPAGGFLAAPGTPIPDLLSTATALHALAGLQRDITPMAEACLDFIDTLWVNEGGFHGHWSDEEVDGEYTFYGLLALGHLSLYTPKH